MVQILGNLQLSHIEGNYHRENDPHEIAAYFF